MRAPDQVMQCVAFVGVPRDNADSMSGIESVHLGATAFFVSIPSQNYPDKHQYVYLVTAKHAATRLQGHKFIIAVNNTLGGGTLITVPAEHSKWWAHPTDDLVDVAVFHWEPQGPNLNPKIIPEIMFMTDDIIKSEGIGAGDEVFITGLFVHLIGKEKNLPIVRTGTFAMMPDELVPTALGDIEAYLIESRSIGGLSGSPVFVNLWREGRMYLAGLMHGHWDIPIENQDMSMFQDAAGNTGQVNMGIAIVIPAKKVLEVLYQPDLVDQRDTEDKYVKQIPADNR